MKKAVKHHAPGSSSSPDSCALCRRTKPLANSHILPAFVFRWIRQTGVTPYFRVSNAPNRRVQGGPTVPLLCSECEGHVSTYEDRFARRVFHPFHSDAAISVPYDDWLLKFCVSVSWRVLVFQTTDASDSYPNLSGHRPRIALARERWRRYLLGDESDVGPFEQHLFPVTTLKEVSGDWPPRMNRFFLRDIGLGIPMGKHNALTYAKLPGFILYGWIAPSTHEWIGSKVDRSGIVKPGQFAIPDFLADHWVEQARLACFPELSTRQQQISDDEIRSNLDLWLRSGTYSALRSDFKVFGRRALETDTTPDGAAKKR